MKSSNQQAAALPLLIRAFLTIVDIVFAGQITI